MVEVVTFGCRINAFESEILKEKFKDRENLIIVKNLLQMKQNVTFFRLI